MVSVDANFPWAGPGGDIRVYLENLATADDVQRYVQEHPFGQPSITKSDRHWNFYVKILDKLEKPFAWWPRLVQSAKHWAFAWAWSFWPLVLFARLTHLPVATFVLVP